MHILLAIPVAAVGLWHLLAPRATPLFDRIPQLDRRAEARPTDRDAGTVRIYGALVLVLAVALAWALTFLRPVSAVGPPSDEPGHSTVVPLRRPYDLDRPSRVDLPGDGPVRLRVPGLGRR
ncbi:hypothetical protein [Cellulosimicrobium sp. CUA-896]|uniref:hypothetical protein n=1 Tax=Cellulosimicrobium sp. CUA-896 TaxID=1517881 RepID=UPI0011153D8A|nr:hypothetical protein [Cellulosimicrobium sp. CUA-896]